MLTKVITLLVSAGLLLAGTPAAGAPDGCGGRIRVPGAERQQVSCLADLTTAGTVASWHTVPADWAGLSSTATVNPAGVAGVSNGGYLTRWQLENRPWLYDGGVDWEGTLLRADGPNLFTYLPAALRHYPAYRSGSAPPIRPSCGPDSHPRRSSCGNSTTRSAGT